MWKTIPSLLVLAATSALAQTPPAQPNCTGLSGTELMNCNSGVGTVDRNNPAERNRTGPGTGRVAPTTPPAPGTDIYNPSTPAINQPPRAMTQPGKLDSPPPAGTGSPMTPAPGGATK